MAQNGDPMTRFLDRAYDDDAPDPQTFYGDWAATYEDEMGENGYATPPRCAAALARFAADRSAPVIDIGCGTGLSGAALREAGFATVDGWDPSAEMLALARPKGIYRALTETDPAAPFAAPDGAYGNAMAAGVLSPGLAPPESLDQVLAFLPTGGCFSFSLNDHAVADGAHVGRVNELLDACVCDLMFREYGEHMPGNDMKSWVYVLRKR